jgi:hypothetical protein
MQNTQVKTELVMARDGQTFTRKNLSFVEDGENREMICYIGKDGIFYPNDPEANYHIEIVNHADGKYMLTIENHGWIDDDLGKLESILMDFIVDHCS